MRINSRSPSGRPSRRSLLLRLCMLLTLSAAVAGVAQADKIYRTVDAEGNVGFSDLPPTRPQRDRKEDKAATASPSEVKVAPLNTYESAGVAPYSLPADASEPVAASSYYQRLAIVQPGQDENFRNNAGNVTIVTTVQPDIRSDHALQLVMDGAVTAASAVGSSIHLKNLDRGTHTIRVRITDQTGNTLIESEPITFHLQRHSILHKANRD